MREVYAEGERRARLDPPAEGAVLEPVPKPVELGAAGEEKEGVDTEARRGEGRGEGKARGEARGGRGETRGGGEGASQREPKEGQKPRACATHLIFMATLRAR